MSRHTQDYWSQSVRTRTIVPREPSPVGIPAPVTSPANHYQTLQVKPYANLAAIRGAYRRLAREFHPDVNFAPEATAQMGAVNEAYAVLRDPARRAAYDVARFRQALREVDPGVATLTPPRLSRGWFWDPDRGR